jgi:phage tail-like protein
VRGLIPRLESPHPLGEHLPALFQEDGFAQRLADAFDEVLAPALLSLDNLDAYLDPALAPEDFLEFLAGWVGIALDETWPVERRRALVASAAELYRLRGTVQGLRAHVAIFTGGEVDIEENGAAAYSMAPGGAVPGTPELRLHVRVHLADPKSTSAARLDTLVAGAKPAHLPHTIEIVAAAKTKA